MNMITTNRAAALAVVALLLTGCHRGRDGAASPATAVQVYVAHASAVTEEITASGSIEAVDKADVAFLVSGRVVAVEAEEGALVGRGTVLARLDPGDFEKTLAIAEAQLWEVKSRHARLARMHAGGSLTDTDFEKITVALRQAEAAAELARRQLAYTVLRAPFDGTLVKHDIAPGTVVSPAVPVFTIVAPGPVWANLGVAETEIDKVKVGQPVQVQIGATSRGSQSGTVDRILPQADLLTRTFAVKVRLENPAQELRHGNVVVGQIITGETRRAITAPPQVVQRHPDGSLFVWLVDPTRRTAVRQLVQVSGLRTTEVEITAGVREGDQIVLGVPHTLFEGARLAVATSP